MFREQLRIGAIIFVLVLILSACGSAGDKTLDAEAIFTAAAETANAQKTEMALASTSTATQTMTETPTVTATATLSSTATVAAAGAAPAASNTTGDRVEFVGDVTIPDGTVFASGQSFKKTWRLKNVGTTSWTTAYTLIYFSGEKMNAPTSLPMTGDVAPNQTVDISVDLISPTAQGQYVTYFMLRNAQGQNFGLGFNADQAFYVWINVASGGTVLASQTLTGATVTGTVTPGTKTPTLTTTSGGNPGAITNVSISVDNSTFAGDCPHDFSFPFQFTVNQTGVVKYSLEADSDDPNVEFNLPAPRSENIQKTGVYNNSFILTINNSMSGWVRLHITSPTDIQTNKINFLLECE